ncbi:MAG: hypothetical protein M3P08_06810 [Thermoproteota archaeon]|nr:hypothetical protein [Thermoproteota archaeon]
MNHKNTTLAIVAIVAATALTAIPFALPQQALAGGNHYKHNDHNSNIKVDQQINQQNTCNSTQTREFPPGLADRGNSSTTCVNIGDNSADIHN